MIPILCFVGYSKTGKTTLLEKLIPLLSKRGYTIGVVKSDCHGFEIDQKGTDSYRLKNAGALCLAVSGKEKFFFVQDKNESMQLEEIVYTYFSSVDIVLAEGFKHSPFPKIEVHHKKSNQPFLGSEISNIIAAVNDSAHDKKIPHFDFTQIPQLADFIETNFLLNKNYRQSVQLMVNGKDIKLKPFIDDMLKEGIRGMLIALRDCADAKEVKINFSITEKTS